MVKARTSTRRKRSSTKRSNAKNKGVMKLKASACVREINPTEELLNEDLIGRAVWECLKEGDSDGVLEVIGIYIEAYNKTYMAEAASVARSTVYSTLKS